MAGPYWSAYRMKVFTVSSQSLHQQRWMSGARVGRRPQRLFPRLPCGLGIRLAAAARAAVAFARRYCSREMMAPSEAPARWPRPTLRRFSSADRRSFASSTRSSPTPASPPPPTAPSKTHAQAGRSRACSSTPSCCRRRRKKIVTTMVPASPAPAPGCRLPLCLRPLLPGCGLPRSAENARRWSRSARWA